MYLYLYEYLLYIYTTFLHCSIDNFRNARPLATFGKTKAITSDGWGHNFHRSLGFDHAWACPGSVPHVYFRFLLTSIVG